ncbi:hypothetical protein E6E07_09335 [Escherichia coli]|nr:hypothetical protein [Escherichia coli]EFN4539151.1 hypothetical protein [Escherichia coli]
MNRELIERVLPLIEKDIKRAEEMALNYAAPHQRNNEEAEALSHYWLQKAELYTRLHEALKTEIK